jgi:hypothetical protein
LSYQEFFNKDPIASALRVDSHTLDDSVKMFTKISAGRDGKGIEVHGPTELGKVLELPTWNFAKKLAAKEYFEL